MRCGGFCQCPPASLKDEFGAEIVEGLFETGRVLVRIEERLMPARAWQLLLDTGADLIKWRRS